MTTFTYGPVIVPTVHLNGTSKGELLGQLARAKAEIVRAHDALRDVEIALAEATPHDRDYYVQGAIVGQEARRQHSERRSSAQEMKERCAELYLHLDEIERGINEQGGK